MMNSKRRTLQSPLWRSSRRDGDDDTPTGDEYGGEGDDYGIEDDGYGGGGE